MASNDDNYKGQFKTGSASESPISLSQAILAPLDAIFKAQVHSARSFLSLVLQLGYKPESELDRSKEGADQLYTLDFPLVSRTGDGEIETTMVKIPQLSIVPIAPLAIEDAEFELDFTVSHIFRHQMLQKEREKEDNQNGNDPSARPWYLVKDPISVRGVMAPSANKLDKSQQGEQNKIKIKIRIGKQRMPAALDKLLTSLSEIVETPQDKT